MAGAAAAAVSICCEGVNLARLLRSLGCRCSCADGLRCACTGFFFSAVTPSASGGQPMQLYEMHRNGVPLAKGTLALMSELLSFQLVSTAIAAAGFLYQHAAIAEAVGRGWQLLLAGMGLNLAAAAILLLIVLRPEAAEGLAGLAVRIVSRFSDEKGRQAERFLSAQLADYRSGARIFRRNPPLIGKTLATTLLQLTAVYSVTYFIYRALGLDSAAFFQVTALQAVLSVSVSVLPLPGAVGVSEGGFLLLFGGCFPSESLAGAMVLARTVSFYLPVAATGIVSAAAAAGRTWKQGKNIDKSRKRVYP